MSKIEIRESELNCGHCRYFKEMDGNKIFCSRQGRWLTKRYCDRFRLAQNIFMIKKDGQKNITVTYLEDEKGKGDFNKIKEYPKIFISINHTNEEIGKMIRGLMDITTGKYQKRKIEYKKVKQEESV